MVTLCEAIKAAQTDLRPLAKSGISLTMPLEKLAQALPLARIGKKHAITLARTVCEVIIGCAHGAEDASIPGLAKRLRCINRALSSVVARYYTQLK